MFEGGESLLKSFCDVSVLVPGAVGRTERLRSKKTGTTVR